jgi:hypothetical protein
MGAENNSLNHCFKVNFFAIMTALAITEQTVSHLTPWFKIWKHQYGRQYW